MSESGIRRLNIEQLTPGMVIMQITRQNGPVRIKKSGLVTSHSMVQGLAEMGVQEVDIDPSQTVEVEAPVARRTPTQQLLRGDHDTRGAQDAQVSEQFNRSLFLPTIQGLPSPWRHTLIQAGQFVAIAILGIGLGFAGGSVSGWWPAVFSSSTLADNGVKTPPEVSSLENSEGGDSQVSSGANSEVTPREASISKDINNKSMGSAAQPAERSGAQESASKIDTDESQPSSANAQGLPSQHAGDDGQAAPEAESSQSEYAGKVLNEPDQSSQAKVSQALLDKFNQAIDELDEAPKTEREPEVPVSVSDSIMRVDELPVRLLTRLPAMKFSAHMYASNPSDRWVRVNGKQRGEGDWINDEVQVVKIEGQRVILAFQGEQFSMAALTDW